MVERDIYSKGNEANVFIDDENNVVRIEKWLSEERAITKYLNLKIASLLFPENFIRIKGFRLERITTDSNLGPFPSDYVTSYIISELALAHPDHATFSRHQKTYEEVTECTCDLCKSHRGLHRSNSYIRTLVQTSEKLEEAGLSLPNDDHTDHCMGPLGIIFFETYFPEPSKVRAYLKKLGKNDFTEMINAMLSYKQMLASGVSGRESFEIAKKVYPHVDLVDYSLNSSRFADSF